MKTSLVLDDALFRMARAEAQRSGRTLSAVVSEWARVGRQALEKTPRKRRSKVPSLNLGGVARVTINSRSRWMDELDALD